MWKGVQKFLTKSKAKNQACTIEGGEETRRIIEMPRAPPIGRT
jgi:hypothetical protein